MTAKEKFEMTIGLIEEMVLSAFREPASEIAELASKKNGVPTRDLATVFSFLTGVSLVSYIKERKMMAAYKELITQKKFCVEKAVELSGYDTQSSFTKAFTRRFGIPPKDAHKQKDSDKLCPQLSWKALSEEYNQEPEHTENLTINKTESVMKKLLSIAVANFTESFLETYERLDSLVALYNFTEDQAIVAYEIAEKQHVDIADAFEYVDDYCSSQSWFHNPEYQAEDLDGNPREVIDVLREELLDEEMLYCRFILGLSADACSSVVSRLWSSFNRKTKSRYHAEDLDEIAASLCVLLEGIPTETVLYYAQYFKENYHGCDSDDEDVLEKYADYLSESWYKENALRQAIIDAEIESDIDTGRIDCIDEYFDANYYNLLYCGGTWDEY